MRFYVTAAIAALIITGAATAAPIHKQAAPTIVHVFWHGNPTEYAYSHDLATVPAGYTWTIKYVLLISEKGPGILPTGGDGTIDVMLDGTPFAETALATGNRVAYLVGPADVTLPAGTDISVFTYSGPLFEPAAEHFYGVSLTIQQKPVTAVAHRR